MCMDIVMNLSLIMSLNLQIFGALKHFFRVGGLYGIVTKLARMFSWFTL